MKRNTLAQYGFLPDGDRRSGRTTDPNGAFLDAMSRTSVLKQTQLASIFKRISEVPEAAVSAELDFTSAYKV